MNILQVSGNGQRSRGDGGSVWPLFAKPALFLLLVFVALAVLGYVATSG